MKLSILLLACLVCSAFAWPNTRRGPPPGSHSGELEQTEQKDPCREMARKCATPPPPENTTGQLLRELEGVEEKIKCFNFLKDEIEDNQRKRGEPASKEGIEEEASKIIKQCACDGNEEPAGAEGMVGGKRRLSERLYRLLRGEQLEEGREEKCRNAMEEAGIEFESFEESGVSDGPESGEESESEGPESGEESESEGPEGGEGQEQGEEFEQEVRELLKLLKYLKK